MRNLFKKILLKAIPLQIKTLIINNSLKGLNIDLSNVHFSQEGEDVILDKIFYDKKEGFFVDVGAHHPIRLSNTYKYYLKGWRGINIDAMPGSMELFNEIRPRDINLEVGVSGTEQVIPFYIFEEKTLNTFDAEQAKKHEEAFGKPFIKVVNVSTLPLYKILEQHLPANQNIDFMSIDVEGLDYQVLITNDWDRFKPKVILVEDIGTSITDLLQGKIHSLLSSKGYEFISKTFHTNFYQLS